MKIDEHVFRVPRDHLLNGTIPWLSTSQADGLQFLVNPEDRREAHWIVTIQSTKKTCHPTTAPTSSQLGSACVYAAEKQDADLGQQDFVLQKDYRGGDHTQWEYRLPRVGDRDQGTVIASCFALANGDGAGLCTSLGTYKNLVYSVGLRDSDVKRLVAIRFKIHEMLSSWEVR